MPTPDILDEKLFDVLCIGAKRIGEFIEATRNLSLDQNTDRLREQAKVALSAVVTHLMKEAPRYHALADDLKDLHRFTEKPFLSDRA